MTRETLQTLSDETLWLMAADAYNRQADSDDPHYVTQQLAIVKNCLGVIFDRQERGETHAAPRN